MRESESSSSLNESEDSFSTPVAKKSKSCTVEGSEDKKSNSRN